jgi:hypothetical protein
MIVMRAPFSTIVDIVRRPSHVYAAPPMAPSAMLVRRHLTRGTLIVALVDQSSNELFLLFVQSEWRPSFCIIALLFLLLLLVVVFLSDLIKQQSMR